MFHYNFYLEELKDIFYFNRFAHTAGPFSSALDFMNESVIWKPMAGGSVAGEYVYGL